VTDAAQADRGGAFAGASLLRGLPVRRCPIGTGQHPLRLPAKKVNPARLIGSPAGPIVIVGRHRFGFSLLTE
jgi:hypothetical protein